jgi:hypothetical protein
MNYQTPFEELLELEKVRLAHLYKYPQCRDVFECVSPEGGTWLGQKGWINASGTKILNLTVEGATAIALWIAQNRVDPCLYTPRTRRKT